MHSLDGILKLADEELNSIVGNGKFRSRDDVETAYKLIDIAKDVYCIWAYEDEEGYSGASYEGRGGRSYRDGSYEGRRNRMSYERGGRGSSRGYGRNSYRGYSRDSKQEYIEELREMMEDAPDDQTRQGIQRMISQMEQQM